MDSLSCYGNLSFVTNNATSSSMWRNIHQVHEEIFAQEITTTPMVNSQRNSSLNPTSFILQNKPYNNIVLNSPNPLIMPNFGISNISTNSPSLDSLDCLLSTTNSINTDTSAEDDGVSVLFPSSQQPSPSPSLETTKNPLSTLKRTRDEMSQVLSFKGGENLINTKRPRFGRCQNSSNISFQRSSNSPVSSDEMDTEAVQQMKEMIYRAAAFRPVNLGVDIVEKPKRKNVKISSDPQTVAARQRRERIGERIRVLQRMVPGGSKMDTASMLDEAANYLKFLRSQIEALESINNYKLEHNHHLVNPGQFNINHSLYPMQNFFLHHTTPSPIHQAKDRLS